MQGIIWNYEQKLLDNFRQTAKGKYELIYLFENHQQQAEMVELDVRADSQRTEVYKTKSEVSMRTWRAPKIVASQGAFVVIPELSQAIFPAYNKRPASLCTAGLCGKETISRLYVLISACRQ